MSIFSIIASLSRLSASIENFGMDGFSLWRNKTVKKQRTISYSLSGLRHKVYLRTHTSDYLVFSQIFIENQYQIALKNTPEVIIDCGANIGLASVYFANKYPNAKIIAIEPEASNFTLLKKNTENYPNVICLNCGIWSRKTRLSIEDTGDGLWAMVTHETDDDTNGKNTINAYSLTDIMSEYSLTHIDILKMDIEGSEKKVFSENYSQWLDKTRLIIIEFHDRMFAGTAKTFFEAIRNYDYRLETKGENIFCDLKKNSIL